MKAVSIDTQSVDFKRPRFIEGKAKSIVHRWLNSLKCGHLIIQDGHQTLSFGEAKENTSLIAKIIVHDSAAYRDVMLNGIVGSGEAYMRGSWSSPDLVNVIRLFCANMTIFHEINKGWASFNKWFALIAHKVRGNNKNNARLNIAAHYDLGNDFFKLFLDETMMYSSAIFPRPDSTLKEASEYKLAHICERLQLQESDHLLEIGTGWGGMAVYAATHYGCQVTTTTISKEQYEYTCEKVKQAGLESKIHVLLDDYRDLVKAENGQPRQYDKLVSIEMIEAVGHEYYKQYFSVCSQLLKPDGLMLIQAITLPDQRFETSKNTTDFIQRYIFPGGRLPSLSVIANHFTKNTNMQIVNVDDITQHYAETLARWRLAFFEKIDEVKAQGFNDIFTRMWDFYLCYCEGGFRERSISTIQVLAAKPRSMQLPKVSH